VTHVPLNWVWVVHCPLTPGTIAGLLVDTGTLLASGPTIQYLCDSDLTSGLPNFQISADICRGRLLPPQASCRSLWMALPTPCPALWTLISFRRPTQHPLTGTFGAIPTTGRFGGGLTNTFFPTPGSTPNTIAVEFYLVDSGHGFFSESDSLSSGELSFGYYATRTPICQGCP
jgi:hypothetical protein